MLAQTLAIGPIFSAAFLAGTVAVAAGFNTPLSVLLAGVGTLGLAYALVLYGRRFAGAGGVHEYLRRGVHPSIGVVGGGAYLLGLLSLGAGGGFVADGYLMDRLLRGELSLDLGWLLWALVFLAVVIAVNYTGVRAGIGAIALTAAISAVPLAVVAVAIIADGGADGNTLAVFDPSRTSWDAVFHGILFAVALFIGFEAVAALGEEARLPRRSIPIAMISSIAIYLAFYLVVTYAGAIGFGEQALHQNAWFASGNPFGELGERYVGHSLGWLVNLAIVLDLLSVLIAFTLAASRLLMALAREGLLPRAVARTSPRYHSPVGGLAVIAAWALLVILWPGHTRYGDSVGLPNILQAILILSATGSYLITLVYLLLAGGALRLLWSDRDRGGLWWRLPVVLAGVAVPILSFDGSLHPFPDHPNDIALYLACAALGLSVLWYAALRLLRPGALRADRPAQIRARDARRSRRTLAPNARMWSSPPAHRSLSLGTRCRRPPGTDRLPRQCWNCGKGAAPPPPQVRHQDARSQGCWARAVPAEAIAIRSGVVRAGGGRGVPCTARVCPRTAVFGGKLPVTPGNP